MDLLVYDERAEAFRALPVQVKASSYRSFSVHDKYKKATALVLAFIWNLDPQAGETTAFALTVAEAEELAEAMKWASAGRLAYSTTAPSKALVAALEPYRSTPTRWRSLLEAAGPAGGRA